MEYDHPCKMIQAPDISHWASRKENLATHPLENTVQVSAVPHEPAGLSDQVLLRSTRADS
jgi:hypothetical protein